MKVAVLHAYSADNSGDGLLVEETLALVREAFGSETQFVVCASHPETFAHLGVQIVNSAPSIRGYNRQYLRMLTQLSEYHLVIGVGGGYLRANRLVEAMKAVAIHGPQLAAAALSKAPTVYLPQSVGPARIPFRGIARAALNRIDRIYLRDERSVSEFNLKRARRSPDLAILSADIIDDCRAPEGPTVVSVRPVNGKTPIIVRELCRQIGDFEGYVQSTTGGNDDRAVMADIGATRLLTRQELMEEPSGPRVVVAVRLHAALMALRAGHYVVHLAYERKGYGAFEDLGLSKYVHNVNMFEPERVILQIQELYTNESVRFAYRSAQKDAMKCAAEWRGAILDELRELAL